VALHLFVEGSARQLQQGHHLGDIAFALLQGVVQALRLEGLHLLRQRPSAAARRGRRAEAEGVAFGGVDQFAHVARPVVGEQLRQFAGRRRWRGTAVALGGLAGEVFEQQRNVLAPLAQRRDMQLGDVQPVQQVLAEAPAAHLFQQIRLGRADHPQVDLDAAVGAQPLQGLLLQYAQQLDLLRQRHAFDLVEEQRAAGGMLDAADALALGAGEGAALMAEQLALEDGFRDRRAVQRHKRPADARAEVMQAARDLFLAAAGLATDQHVDVGPGQLQHLASQVIHGAGHAQQLRFDTSLAGELLAQLAVLADQPALVHRAAYAVEQAFRGEGFFDEVVGALAQRLHRHGHVTVAGGHDHRQVGIQFDQPFEQAEAVEIGHTHVADQHAGKVAIQRCQRLAGAGEGTHLKAGKLQPLLHGLTDRRLVVDEDYLPAHCLLLAVASRQFTRRRALRQPAASG